MRSYVAVFVVAAVVAATLTPFVRAFAMRWGAVSRPGGRNVNERAVPRYGGIAICAAFFLATAALYFSEASAAASIHAERRSFLALVVGGVGLCAVGAFDDTRGLRALHKLYAQIAAGTLAFACGFRIDAILLPLFGTLPMGVFALPVTVLWIVGVTNAINLIDGLDGLAGGVVFFAALTNLVVACVTGATFVAITMSAVLGAVFGFLIFNFNPARIFMGDAGSYFLGFVLGTMSLSGASQKASTAVSLLVPILALGLPIVDTLLSILRRFLERRPLFAADRGHIHHRLLDMGITHRRAVLILYGVCLVLTVAAIGVSLGRSWQVGVAILVASVVVAGLARFLGYFEYLVLMRRQKARLRSPETERLRRAVPAALSAFEHAATEEEVWGALERLLSHARLGTIEIVASKNHAVRAWGVLHQRSELVSARYPVGAAADARADVRFRWQSDAPEVAPQSEVLLQLVADGMSAALLRTGSAYAPRRAVQVPDPIEDTGQTLVEAGT